nr:transporter [Sphingobium nicotianae]
MLGLALLAASGLARSEDLRDLCADRPGLGTPACTVDKGHAVLELGLADWTRDDRGPVRTDTLITGDTLLRYGVTGDTEVQIGWTALGHVRVRDASAGAIDRATAAGDVTLALRHNLHNPDGSGLSVALMPYASLPVGRSPVGRGDWGAGLIVPLSFDLGHGLALAATPRIDAVVNGDGRGRHLGYGSVAGLQIDLADHLSLAEEVSLYRDEDPDGHTTQALDGLALAWQAGKNSQWDLGGVLGLNRDSPDVALSIGYAARF